MLLHDISSNPSTRPRQRMLACSIILLVLMLAVSAQADDVQVTGPADCLSEANPCGLATVSFDRTSTEPLRGLSVEFELSEELALCSDDLEAELVVFDGAGALFDGASNLQVQRLDLGDNRYVVDLVLLGEPCGPTSGGTVFTIGVTRAADQSGDIGGTITIIDVIARDCGNMPLPGDVGAPGTVFFDAQPPAAITDLEAVQVTAGNDFDGTTQVELSWTASGDDDAEYMEIWRQGFGDYPEYDDAAGAEPTLPVEAGNGWTLVTTVPASDMAYTDDPAARDFYYYALRVFDGCGNSSTIGANDLTTGTLSYHLGDVTDPDDEAAHGDNAVDVADISALGAAYGTADGDPDYDPGLDCGPTTDFAVSSRPLTDDLVQFEDLIVMAINFELVGRIEAPGLEALARNEVWVKMQPAVGQDDRLVAEIVVRGNGRMQGLSVPLKWNTRAVRPVSMTAGDLLARQGGPNLVFAPAPGMVDGALLGVRDHGIRGEGTLARVIFEVHGDQAPQVTIGRIDARDADNRPLPVVTALGEDLGDQPGASAERSSLGANTPNPFNPSTTLAFRLAETGRVQLGVFDVRGRLVRSLIDGSMPAGDHAITWQGRNDAGEFVSSGTYFVRLTAPDHAETRTITLVK